MEHNIFISTIGAPNRGFYDSADKWVKAATEPQKTTVAAVAEYIRTQAEHETQELRNIEQPNVKRKQRMVDGSFVDYTAQEKRGAFYKSTHFKRAYFGGVFQGGFKASNMVQHSDVFVLDFDDLGTGEQVEQARAKLLHDTQVQPLLLFVSPSGDGLKMVCRLPFTNTQTWRKHLAAVWYYIEQTHGLVADAACKDLNRGCYLPHDANVHFNPAAQTVLDFDKWTPPVQEHERPVFEYGRAMDTDVNRAFWYAEQLESHGLDITGTQPEWARMGMAVAELGESGRGIFHMVSRAGFANYEFTECDALFDYCLAKRNGSVGIATFIDAAKRAIGTTYEQEHKNEYKAEKQMKDTNTQPKPKNAPSGEKTGKTDAPQERPTLDIEQTMFHNPTLEEICTAFGHVPPAIPTGYFFGVGNEREELTLPNQALTIIAAQTSGGKTRMLENVALRVADYNTENTQGETLFFSLEEPTTDVLIEMANICFNEQLTVGGVPGKNADIIRNAQRAMYKANQAKTDEERVKAMAEFAPIRENDNLQFSDEYEKAKRVIAEFHARYLAPRPGLEHHDAAQPLLRIYGNDAFCKVETMCQAVQQYAEKSRVKAVFVDYLGMFRTTDTNEMRLPKTERIERTLDKLERLAKDLNVPIIISAQLKREKDATPWTLRNSSVADSADVERSCNTMVLLWNSREPFEDMKEQECLQKAGFYSEQGGRLFARMTKRRGGIRGGAVVLKFAESTGKIEMGVGITRDGVTSGAPLEDILPQAPQTNQNIPW